MINIKSKARPSHNEVTPIVMKMIDGELQEVRRYPTTTNTMLKDGLGMLHGGNYLSTGSEGYGRQRLLQDNPGWGIVRYLELGTGTAVPTVSSDGMSSPSGIYAEISYDVFPDRVSAIEEEGVKYLAFDTVFIFAQGDLNGTYTEFGTSEQPPGTNYHFAVSAGLFRDSAGDPVAISVASDEQLFVNYRFKLECVDQVTGDWDGSSSSETEVWANIVDDLVINVNGNDHTVRVSQLVYSYRISTSSSANISFYRPNPQNGDYGYIYGDGSTVTINNGDNGTLGEIELLSKSVAGDNLSVTYTFRFRVFPAANLLDVSRVRFACYDNSPSENSMNIYFTPAIPLTPGDSMEINISWTVDWSGA